MELNREQIIKALECWGSGCPCHEKCSILEHEESANCLRLTTRSAIALIKELTEENERLQKHEESVAIVCKRAEEHYDTLYEQAKDILKAEVKADTVRKMAERLKQILREEGRSGHYIKATIDQVAKEFDPHWMDQDGK